MDKIGVYKKQLKSPEVKICLETIRNINGAADIQCDFDEEKGMVIIVGNSSVVNLASKYIDVIITAHEQGIEYTKLRVVFSSEAEINLIKKLEKFTQLKMDFPDVKVHIDMNECIVELEGSANEVSGAKMILCDAKNALITVFSDTLPSLSAKLYTLPQTIDFISEGLKRKNLIASWCVSDQRLIICCPFKEVLDKTVNTIRSAVVQNDILTSPESASVTKTDIWSEKMKEWDEMCHGRVIVSLDDSDTGSKKIEVYATADLAPKLSDDIAGILAKESEKSEEKKEPDYSLGSEEDSQAVTTTILVSNLPADITEEFLKHFFEDRSHETENVLEVKINSKNNKANVKFKDNNAVEYVLRRKHKLCGKGLKVQRCHGLPDMTAGNFVSPALVTSDKGDVEKKYQSFGESLEDGSPHLYRETQRLLARLTKDTFRTVVPQIQALPIKSETELKEVVDIIFEKAISDDQSRCVVYANLCRCLSMIKVPSDSKSGEMVNFRALILSLCQKEFEKPSELSDGDGWTDDQLRRPINRRKQRSLGNIRLFGELFKLNMLTENIMHDCVFKLLTLKNLDDLEGVCTLLTTIGKKLDVEKAKPRMDQYFRHMANMVNNKTIPPYIRIILKDVIDLRM
ncbi:uncharacterized protein LOC128552199, partial [Mercenaria mercenaria]|uniref:uncharacterized protein LOC128552199 n=1 Tax=Mercenaria mercenaria TaxID=6596 RepID=UPI00234EA067